MIDEGAQPDSNTIAPLCSEKKPDGKNGEDSGIFLTPTTGYDPSLRIRILFATKLCVPVTRPDWLASLRDYRFPLSASPSQSCVGYCSQLVSLDFT